MMCMKGWPVGARRPWLQHEGQQDEQQPVEQDEYPHRIPRLSGATRSPGTPADHCQSSCKHDDDLRPGGQACVLGEQITNRQPESQGAAGCGRAVQREVEYGPKRHAPGQVLSGPVR